MIDVSPTIQNLGLKAGYAFGVPLGSSKDNPGGVVAPVVTDPGYTDSHGGLSYTWAVLKDGKPFNTYSGPSLNFTPDVPNGQITDLYQVTLTVHDSFGGSATASGSFTVFDPNNLTVNSLLDSSPDPKVLTLRMAIADASAISGRTVIKFDPSLAHQSITLTTSEPTPGLGNSAIAVTGGDVVIDGSDAPGLTIYTPNGSNLRLFYVGSNAASDVLQRHPGGGPRHRQLVLFRGGGRVCERLRELLQQPAARQLLGRPGRGRLHRLGGGACSPPQTTFAHNVAAQGRDLQRGGSYQLYGDTIVDNVAYSSPGGFRPGGRHRRLYHPAGGRRDHRGGRELHHRQQLGRLRLLPQEPQPHHRHVSAS